MGFRTIFLFLKSDFFKGSTTQKYKIILSQKGEKNNKTTLLFLSRQAAGSVFLLPHLDVNCAMSTFVKKRREPTKGPRRLSSCFTTYYLLLASFLLQGVSRTEADEQERTAGERGGLVVVVTMRIWKVKKGAVLASDVAVFSSGGTFPEQTAFLGKSTKAHSDDDGEG